MLINFWDNKVFLFTVLMFGSVVGFAQSSISQTISINESLGLVNNAVGLILGTKGSL